MAKNYSFDKSSLTKEERTFFENRKLKDKFFFGKFKETKSGYQISDIRRSDFSKINFDWSQSISDIDRQLYAKYGLSDNEIAFIEKMIKPMED